MSKYKKVSPLILLLIIITFHLHHPIVTYAKENSETKSFSHINYIEQVIWADNDEILIVDKYLSQGSLRNRVIKYTISKNHFSFVYNSNYEKEQIIRLSNDGKTMLIYNFSSKNAVLKRDNKSISKVNIRNVMSSMTGAKAYEERGYHEVFTPIKVFKDMAVFTVGIFAIDYLEDEKLVFAGHNNIDSKLDDNFKNAIFFPQMDMGNPNCFYYWKKNSLYEFIVADNCTRKIFGVIYNINHFDDHADKIQRIGNEIYFTASFKDGPEAVIFEDPRIKKNLYKYDMITKKITRLQTGVNWFDVSNNYIATTFYYARYDRVKNLELKVFDRKRRILLIKKFSTGNLRLGERPNTIPTISPDETKIILFKSFAKEPLIIIDTDEFKEK